MITTYQPQYKSGESWLSSGFSQTREQASNLVRAKPEEFVGPNPTRRIVRRTEEVMKIGVIIQGSE